MSELRDRFNKMFSLSMKQPWLGELEAELSELMGECENQAQIDLLCDLLLRFVYIDAAQEGKFLHAIAEKIVGLGYPQEQVQVVAMSADDDADSGQAVLYGLKPLFAKLGWADVKLVNQFGKAQRHIQEKRVVCLVDEFVGTGRTVIGRVKSMRIDFKNNKGVEDAEINLFVYAGMADALKTIEEMKLCESVTFLEVLQKGIEKHMGGDPNLYDCMAAIEGKLQTPVRTYALPNNGDGKCEALYGRAGGNAPNSVFPVFWWPETAAGTMRKTVLARKF